MEPTPYYINFHKNVTKLYHFIELGEDPIITEYIDSLQKSMEYSYRINDNLTEITEKMPEEFQFYIIVDGRGKEPFLVDGDEHLFYVEGIYEKYESMLEYYPFLLEQCIIIAKSYFDYYINDIIRYHLSSFPNVLLKNDANDNEKKKVNLELIYKHNDIEDLRNNIIEDEIYRIGYKSLRNLIKYMKDVLGLKLVITEEDIEKMCEVIEIRNIIIHNGGVVNNNFILKTKGKSSYNLNEKIILSKELTENCLQSIRRFVFLVDRVFSEQVYFKRLSLMEQ